MLPLSGKVAIITGAGSGLGKAVTLALAGAGASIVPIEINPARLERIATQVAEGGTEVLPLQVDVSDAAAIDGAIRQVDGRFGRVDILVNNAGIDHTLCVNDLTVEQWDQVMAVNLRAPFLMAKAVFPLMQQQRQGHIVNIASTASVRAWANAAPYHASKWGLMGLSRSLGVEGRPYNIFATTIIPGGMQTAFFDRFDTPPDPTHLQSPAAVAEVILFVVSRRPDSVIQEVLVTAPTETSWP